MAHVSHKLSSSLEGALAGGGDPATSPLYVFGPFLRLIVVAGVAQVTFGASVWMVIVTIDTIQVGHISIDEQLTVIIRKFNAAKTYFTAFSFQ